MNKTTITLALIIIISLVVIGVVTLREKPVQPVTLPPVVTEPAVILPGETPIKEVNDDTVPIVQIDTTLPASLKDVEMVTQKNEYFEITFPKDMDYKEILPPAKRTDEYMGYGISPKLSSVAEMNGPTIGITVLKTDEKEFDEANFDEGQEWIIVNGRKGIYWDGSGNGGGDGYSFIKDGKYYTIDVHYNNEVHDKYTGMTEDEIRWIISTFKIVE